MLPSETLSSTMIMEGGAEDALNAPKSYDDDNRQLFKGHIILNKNITFTNYMAYNLYFFIITFSFVSADTLQPILLKNVSYYNIAQDDVATVNSGIQLYDMICKVMVAPIYGILTDTIGRKFFATYGIVLMALGIVFMPFVQVIYPNYLLFRLIYANGAIASLCSPLLADYVHFKTKGRAAGLLVIMAACGAMFSTFICLDLQDLSLGTRYVTVACIVFFGGLITCVGIKSGNYFKEQRPSSEIEPANIPPIVPIRRNWRFFLSGIYEAKNPWILMGYLVSFLSRGDSAILTYTIVLWSQTYYDSDQESQNEAATQAQTLAGLAYSMIFLSAILYGVVADKFSKYKLTIFILLVTIAGLGLLVLAPDPNSALAWLSMVPIGLGMGGLLTTSLQFVNKYADRRYRGNINSISTAAGVIGIFIVSVAGGYMIDNVSNEAPFLLYGGFCLIILGTLVLVAFLNKEIQDEKAFDQMQEVKVN
jgi:MFS family permease